jgi:hypothetical protein
MIVNFDNGSDKRKYFFVFGVWKGSTVCGKYNHRLKVKLQGHIVVDRLNQDEENWNVGGGGLWAIVLLSLQDYGPT